MDGVKLVHSTALNDKEISTNKLWGRRGGNKASKIQSQKLTMEFGLSDNNHI